MEIKVGEYTVKYSDEELKVVNSIGNLVHAKNSEIEFWYDYDNDGNCIHAKNSSGLDRWSEFDNDGHKLHTKWQDGSERWYHNGDTISKQEFDMLYETKTTYASKKKS